MIHIAFNIDNNFKNYLKVVINSILDHTKSEVTFHIVGLTDFEMSGVANIKCYGAPDLSDINRETDYNEITSSACYRLYLPDILPKEVSKVLYLDTDVIVLDDVSELYNYEVKVIAGVLDPDYEYHARKNNLEYGYINSGVILMNLHALCNLDYRLLLKQTQDSKYDLSLLDQDMINIAYGQYMQYLPEKWNVYAWSYPHINENMKKARLNPGIIHWCGTQKPWKQCAQAWRKEDWLKYNY